MLDSLRVTATWTVLLVVCIFAPECHGQGIAGGGFGAGGGIGGGGIGAGGGFGGGAGQQGGIGNANFPGGILIDSNGVVTATLSRTRSTGLTRRRLEAAAEQLPSELNQSSTCRKISLVKLEAAMKSYVDEQKHVPDDMQFLAGLQRIDYIFVYPDERDLVIAGPAEGFAPDHQGRCVGLTTGHPPLRLDDLIIALRATRQNNSIGCSIDPDTERLAAMNRYTRQNSSTTTVSHAKQRYDQMRRILGMQAISVWGVPEDSHFSQVLVESDYQMKRIMMGIVPSRVRGVPSYLSMLLPQGNCMQRFWFTPKYEACHATEDGNAYQLAGPRAELLSQEELVSRTGQRTAAPETRATTQRFSAAFTEHFPELAETWPVFAQLQNLIDLSITAALLYRERLPEKAGWRMGLFLDEKRVSLVKGTVPKQTPSLVTIRKATRGMLIALICGGVDINTNRTLKAIEFQTDDATRLTGTRQNASPPSSKADAWWWD